MHPTTTNMFLNGKGEFAAAENHTININAKLWYKCLVWLITVWLHFKCVPAFKIKYYRTFHRKDKTNKSIITFMLQIKSPFVQLGLHFILHCTLS